MLRLHKILLTHFKNYDLASFDFTEQVVGICGLNGKGKTNLLDAIYYCCFTKSYFTNTDALNTAFNKEGFRLEAAFENEGPKKIICIHRGSSKKEFSLNDVSYEKLSGHIGLLPAVMVAPDDIEIINAGGEVRRKYIDTILCQLDADYLQQLMQYNRLLQQRNSLLKRFAEQGKADLALLEILNMQMAAPGNYIFAKRKDLVAELKPMIQSLYHRMANNKEAVELYYESKLHDDRLVNLLVQYQSRDLASLRSNAGIHKDDIRLELNGQLFKTVASQGQRKSLLFALKLAEYQLIKKYKGFSPILLLDDVFEKLDAERMHELLNWVCKENKGQVFISDTHRERLEQALTEIGNSFQIITLDEAD